MRIPTSWRRIAGVASLPLLACAASARAADCDATSIGLVPLSELGTARHLGLFEGGLYPGGSNSPPPAHHAEGIARAAAIAPLDPSGAPSPDGRLALLSVGMSNTSLEFCSSNGLEPCEPATFADRVARLGDIGSPGLAVVNGARSSLDAQAWEGTSAPIYQRIQSESLAPANLGEAQVQVVWIKLANGFPTRSLPDPEADATDLARRLAEVVRTLASRYPNLRIAFLSNRIYAGYADIPLSPEPFAYETGFAVKRLITAQIDQVAGLGVDPLLGDLDHRSGVAPWLAWGPDLWADGLDRRADGLEWECADFASDGTHPSASGQAKVAARLLDFMTTSPYARPWFSPATVASVPSSSSLGLAALTIGAIGIATLLRPRSRAPAKPPIVKRGP